MTPKNTVTPTIWWNGGQSLPARISPGTASACLDNPEQKHRRVLPSPQRQHPAVFFVDHMVRIMSFSSRRAEAGM